MEGTWRENPAGALLLADAAAERARGEQVKQVFESAFGTPAPVGNTGPFSRSAPDLPLRAARAVSAWQDHLIRLASDRSPEAVAVAMLAEGSADVQVPEAQPQGGPVNTTQARADLLDRIRLLFDEELLGFAAVIDAAGPCDEVAAIRLYQAEYSLEAVR